MATLKRRYASQGEIPEGQAGLYVEKDGAWFLDVENDEAAMRAVEHERKQRQTALTEKKALEERLATLEADAQKQADKGTGDPATDPQLKALLGKVEQMERQLANAEKARLEGEEREKATQQKLAQTNIKNALRKAAVELGIKEERLEDVLELKRVSDGWTIGENDSIINMDGDQPRYSRKDTSQIMSPKERLAEVLKNDTDYFKPSTGAGVPAGGGFGRNGNSIILTADQGSNHAAYMAAKDRAAKEGKELVIAE